MKSFAVLIAFRYYFISLQHTLHHTFSSHLLFSLHSTLITSIFYCLNFTSLSLWTKVEDFKNVKLSSLPFYDEINKLQNKNNSDNVYTNFIDWDVQEDDTECESFRIVSIDSLLVYESKYYMEVYLDKYVNTITSKQMADSLDDNLFENQILEMLHYDRCDIREGIDPTKINRTKECMIFRYWFFNNEVEFLYFKIS